MGRYLRLPGLSSGPSASWQTTQASQAGPTQAGFWLLRSWDGSIWTGSRWKPRFRITRRSCTALSAGTTCLLRLLEFDAGKSDDLHIPELVALALFHLCREFSDGRQCIRRQQWRVLPGLHDSHGKSRTIGAGAYWAPSFVPFLSAPNSIIFRSPSDRERN